METRDFVRLARSASVIGMGCWQLVADWGSVDDATALSTLHAAADAGVTFFDTADVYGDGRSERLVGQFIRERADTDLFVATKTGRRAAAQEDSHYTEANLRSWIARSLDNLGVERLDLVQWHCPPTATIERDSMYDLFDQFVSEGLIAGYGVSVETVQQALTAIAHPHIASVQIIANAFRLRPFVEVMPVAAQAGVAIIVRLPLASGLLAGTYTRDSTFSHDDHRTYNRNGEAFDKGETFSGVPFDIGVDAAAQLATFVTPGVSAAQAALRWVIDQPGVTTIIPGARNVTQAQANASVALLPATTPEYSNAVIRIYDEVIREHVHNQW